MGRGIRIRIGGTKKKRKGKPMRCRFRKGKGNGPEKEYDLARHTKWNCGSKGVGGYKVL
jgi:hypothetical protein